MTVSFGEENPERKLLCPLGWGWVIRSAIYLLEIPKPLKSLEQWADLNGDDNGYGEGTEKIITEDILYI